jgi:hypothetical protein
MVERIKEILEKKLSKHPVIGELLKQNKLISFWNDEVGQNLAEVSWPISLRNGCLMLAVLSPAWHQEVSLLKKQLLERLNKFLGRRYVKEIKCLVISQEEIKKLKEKQEDVAGVPEWYLPEKAGKETGFKSNLSRLGLMDEELKNWRQAEKQIIKCPVCERSFRVFRDRLCPYCRGQERSRVFCKIVELIRKQPEKNFLQLKKLWPDLRRTDWKSAREFVIEEGEKILKFFKKTPGPNYSPKMLQNCRSKLVPYLILTTGRSLDKIERNLLKKILGDKIYYCLKDSLV